MLRAQYLNGHIPESSSNSISRVGIVSDHGLHELHERFERAEQERKDFQRTSNNRIYALEKVRFSTSSIRHP